ncbi:hypothetical protein HGM15179_013018 [Zosterops borbonicus]|uniref:NAD(P)(+)--arginine ADP-ribosyltransferase n=1 Tax=Zosterops borbonicus TaxID=364589 RepID=A0A8K1G963_9PASS|nr:hypothetical protein HGM15179_013018 [Zosterops borbonicus]
MAQWQKRGSIASPLTPDQAVALMAYTMKELNLYKEFNDAVREAGNSSWKYRNKFHFKSLHFLLTRALQKLRCLDKCQDVFRGPSGKTWRDWSMSREGMELRKDLEHQEWLRELGRKGGAQSN